MAFSAWTCASLARGAEPPTFSEDVAPIFESRCVICHRPGEIAPMPLTTFEEIRPWAKAIRREVAARRMPPWHADREGGPYNNDISLTDKEIATITAWVEGGSRRGEPLEGPLASDYPDGWMVRTPDLVYRMPEPFELKATGDDVFHCFVFPPAERDYWAQGVEFRPGNRLIDHHAVIFIDPEGVESIAAQDKHEGVGYPCGGFIGFQTTEVLTTWTPGGLPEVWPEGVARPMPKGSRLVLQIHYHPSGKVETDRSSIGVYLVQGTVRQRLRTTAAGAGGIDIAPGESNYHSVALHAFDRDVHIHAVYPHMHLLGKTVEMHAFLPDRTVRPLVFVERYDYHWQRSYQFEQPVALPAGSRVLINAWYDNSEANPRNPNSPPIRVKSGAQTNDEMNVGIIYYTFDGEDLNHELPSIEQLAGTPSRMPHLVAELEKMEKKTGHANALTHYARAVDFVAPFEGLRRERGYKGEQYEDGEATMANPPVVEGENQSEPAPEAFDSAIAEVLEGARLDYAQHLDPMLPFTERPPFNLNAVRRIFDRLVEIAREQTANGDPAAAADTLLAALSMARDLGAPGAILTETLTSQELAAAAARKLRELIASGKTPAPTLGLIVRGLSTMAFASRTDADRLRGEETYWRRDRKKWESLGVENFAPIHERYWRLVFEYFSANPWDRDRENFEHNLQKVTRLIHEQLRTRFLDTAAIEDRFIRTEATLGAALLEAAIARFRATQGRLPARLEQLVPGELERLPLNPFSGLSFAYDPEAPRGPVGVVDGRGRRVALGSDGP